jgi:hypothetical protein
VKPVAAQFEFAPQFSVIVDFTVEGNYRVGVVRNDWLVSADEIDDFQTRCAHRADARTENTLLVRPAMEKRGGGAFNAPVVRIPVFMSETGYPTQWSFPLIVQSNHPPRNVP